MTDAQAANRPYLLFNHQNYYPSGGAFDYIGSFELLEEAKAAAVLDKYHMAHIAIVESDRLVVVAEWPNAFNEDAWSSGRASWRHT